jgi:hypothetical protein
VGKPALEWDGADADVRNTVAEWTKQRGDAARSYPAALVWCLKKPGGDLQQKVEDLLAWRRVKSEIDSGTLKGEFEAADIKAVATSLKEAEEAAKDEVWASYRFVVVADQAEPDGIAVIDLGAGHSSGGESLCGRAVAALKAESALNETCRRRLHPAKLAARIGKGWGLGAVRPAQELPGRLSDAPGGPGQDLARQDLRVRREGRLRAGVGRQADGSYQRLWFQEPVDPADVTFDKDVFLLTKRQAEALRQADRQIATGNGGDDKEGDDGTLQPEPQPEPSPNPAPNPGPGKVRVRVSGSIPPEVWSRFGTKILPKLKAGEDLAIDVSLSADIPPEAATGLQHDLAQILEDLDIEQSASGARGRNRTGMAEAEGF